MGKITVSFAESKSPIHILHFIGHGEFDDGNQTGGLLFETDTGRGERITAEQLNTLLRDHSSLRLVFLNSCEGARSGSANLFAGLAQTLAQNSLPAVIAMQYIVSDDVAIKLAPAFYKAIANNYPVDAALAEARKALFQNNQLEWGTPVLFMRAQDGMLFTVSETSQKTFWRQPQFWLTGCVLLMVIISLIILRGGWPPKGGGAPPPGPTTPTLVAGAVMTVTVAGVDFAFVYVSGGEFTMGLPQKNISPFEYPQRRVAVPAFWIGRTEVTNAQYRLFVDAADGYEKNQWWTSEGLKFRNTNHMIKPVCSTVGQTWDQVDYPVVCVSWYEAYAYASWLTEQTGHITRLPTEAEWEKAARGDKGEFLYPWGNDEPKPDDNFLNYSDSKLNRPAAVGTYPKGMSPYGALDMAGNVWEWTSTRSASCDGKNKFDNDNTDGCRMVRGGSWQDGPASAYTTMSYPVHSNIELNNYGLRLVLVAPQ